MTCSVLVVAQQWGRNKVQLTLWRTCLSPSHFSTTGCRNLQRGVFNQPGFCIDPGTTLGSCNKTTSSSSL